MTVDGTCVRTFVDGTFTPIRCVEQKAVRPRVSPRFPLASLREHSEELRPVSRKLL